MRWVTYVPYNESENMSRAGLLTGDEVHGLEAGIQLIDLLTADGGLDAAAERARSEPSEIHPLSEVQLRAPLPRPASLRDFSAFEEHMRNGLEAIGQKMGQDWYQIPVFYFNNHNAVKAPEETVVVPGGSERMDFELEVAAVLGKGGRDIDPARAGQHIAGFTIYNDWSARDLQTKETATAPIGPAKGKDFANSLGPWLVTPDELEPRRAKQAFDLGMRAYVNDRQVSAGNLADIYWSFEEMVAYASRSTDLLPGDVLGSGTCGSGCLLELSLRFGSEEYPWLKDGDDVRLEVDGLGVLRNGIRSGPAAIPLPSARP